MKTTYSGHRYPPQIISYAVYLYHRFTLSFRDIEEMLAIRGIEVSYESIRYWCKKFGNHYSREIRKGRGELGDRGYLDEVFIQVRGQKIYLWRAVDQNGDEIDILVQRRRNKGAAAKFFKKLLKGESISPLKIITDKLKSYSAAKRDILPSVEHSTQQYENNRCENSHQPTRRQERQMLGFKSQGQAQRFLSWQGIINNLFRHPRHHMRASIYRALRSRSFERWSQACCIQNV